MGVPQATITFNNEMVYIILDLGYPYLGHHKTPTFIPIANSI